MSCGAITIILNSSAGNNEKERTLQQIMSVLKERAVTIVELKAPDDFSLIAEQAVLEATQRGALVAVAGGDGTVNLVAALCAKHQVPLGVIPLGTFNYFARALAIPADPAAAAQVLIDGVIRPVAAGYVNQHLFLNNASFGMYTRIIRNREQDKSRFGRFRIVALLSAIVTLMRGQRPFAIKLSANGIAEVRRTAMVFFGNNTLQLDNLALDVAQCTQADRLAVVVLKPLSRLAMARLLLRGAVKHMGDDDRLEMFCADQVTVETKRRSIDVVIDGEVIRCATPLDFRVVRNGLNVITPKQETPS